MNESRVFRHEDNSVDAKVFYSLKLVGLEENIQKLVLGIEKMPNEIYHDSKNEKVLVPPSFISVSFTPQETIKMMGLFVEASSLYMSSIRKKLYFKNSLRLELEPKESKYKIIFNAVNKKISGSGRQKNSARLLMTFIDKETDTEVISIKLKKTRVVMLMQIVKSLYEEYVHKYSFHHEDINGARLSLVRVEDTVAIGGVWIHGREIQKFQDFIERIIFDFKFRVGEGKEFFKYRQVSAGFAYSSDIAQINLVRYDERHRVYLDPNGDKEEHSFIINSEVAAIFYMLLPKSIGFNVRDIEMFSTQNPAEVNFIPTKIDEEDELEVEEEDNVVLKDRQATSSLDSGDFILNMIETQLVLSVNKKRRFNARNREGKLSLAVRYRDFVIENDEYTVGRVNKESGEYEVVRKLAKCVIDLKIDWLYIFALCAESLHSAEDMASEEYGNHSHLWRFQSESIFGNEQYGLRVVSDPNNKVPAVLIIDYFPDDFKEFTLAPLPTTGGARMRIPLFKEHVRTLLKGIIGLSSQYENYYWVKKFPVYSDDFDEVTGDMSLGIRRFFHKDIKKEVVSFGIVGRSTEQVYLTDNDRDTMFMSAYYRLMYGRWLQFAGEQISITSDGWITDRFNEYKIEFDLESSSGAKGSLPAMAILFATARSKKNEQMSEYEQVS